MECVVKVCPPVCSDELNALFARLWPDHRTVDMLPILEHALVYVCGYEGGKLVGFAKVVGDGGVHGFLLDPTVLPEKQRMGIGRRLVEACAEESRRRGIEWLHGDFEPRLKYFYASCGFSSTSAALRDLRTERLNEASARAALMPEVETPPAATVVGGDLTPLGS